MLKLYFIRHGETLSNTWDTLQGWSDTPLTTNGINQGRWLGIGLKDVDFLKIYTSTSERAYDTACFVRVNNDTEIIMCKGLKELNFGMLETRANVFEGCETYEERVLYEWDKVGGENIHMVFDRIKKTIYDILKENEGKQGNIACVSHGISILNAVKVASEEEYEKWFKVQGFKNCSVTILSYENNELKVEEVNNTEYVEKGKIYEETNK